MPLQQILLEFWNQLIPDRDWVILELCATPYFWGRNHVFNLKEILFSGKAFIEVSGLTLEINSMLAENFYGIIFWLDLKANLTWKITKTELLRVKRETENSDFTSLNHATYTISVEMTEKGWKNIPTFLRECNIFMKILAEIPTNATKYLANVMTRGFSISSLVKLTKCLHGNTNKETYGFWIFDELALTFKKGCSGALYVSWLKAFVAI